MLYGMPAFDAICTSFGTTGTGGFGIKGDSIASYSPATQYIVAIFMLLSGINYSMFFLMLKRRWKQIIKLEEVWWYLGIAGVTTAIIFTKVKDIYPTLEEAFRHSFFQVASLITSTGFATTDFNLWPALASMTLIVIMFVGACAGSTGGGMKVSRMIVLYKGAKHEMKRVLHPKQVKKISMDGHIVEHEVVRNTNAYLVAFIILFVLSLLAVSLDPATAGASNNPLVTNFTAVAATMNNIGPGLDAVGPVGNFAFYSWWSKLVFIFDMLAGRLELFPMLVLFSPTTWRKN
jgi:trk system potassium uptake protein TrkH